MAANIAMIDLAFTVHALSVDGHLDSHLDHLQRLFKAT